MVSIINQIIFLLKIYDIETKNTRKISFKKTLANLDIQLNNNGVFNESIAVEKFNETILIYSYHNSNRFTICFY